MTDPLFCLTVLFLLGWVIYLKWQVGELNKKVDQMSRVLKHQLKGISKDVEIGEDVHITGHKPGWLK